MPSAQPRLIQTAPAYRPAAPAALRGTQPAADAPKWRPGHFRWVLFVLMLLTIGRFHQHYSVLMLLRPGMLLTAVALGFAVLNPGAIAREGLRTWPSRVMIALGAWSIVSALFGISVGGSLAFIVEFYSKVFLFWALLTVAMRSARDIRFFMWSYVLSAAFLVYLAMFVFSLTSFHDGAINRLDNLYMYDSNDIGCIFSVAIPFALLLFQTSGPRGKVATGLILVGIAGATALGGSRGGLLGILAVGLSTLVLASDLSWTKRLAFVAVFAGGLAAFAPPGYWAQMQTMKNLENDYNLTDEYGRLKIAKRGLGYFYSHPVFGIGAGNFQMAEGTISPLAKDQVAEQVMWIAPHNSFLQTAAEMGLPGFLLWTSLIVGGVIGMRRMRRRMPREWRTGTPDQRFLYLATTYIPTALIGFAVTASFVSFAYHDILPIIVAMVSGMYLAVGRAVSEPAAPGPVPVPRHWAPPGVLGRPRGA